MQVTLPLELEQIVQTYLNSGKYQNAEEVLLAGVQLLQREETLAGVTFSVLGEQSQFSPLTLSGVFYGKVTSHIDEPDFRYTASFLRFFDNGDVISALVAFNNLDVMSVWTNSISKWFDWEYRHVDSSEYTLTDKKIEFWTNASQGHEIFHSGNYNEDELTLDVSPHDGVWNYGCKYKRLTSN